jgi:hypothetical protein
MTRRPLAMYKWNRITVSREGGRKMAVTMKKQGQGE